MKTDQRPRVLIVDDVSTNRHLLGAILQDQGWDLSEASSGVEALALAAEQLPDLVLLDVMMPGLDGYETARRLKEQAQGAFLPIVLVTALSDRTSRVKGLQAGADDFLTKPVDRVELVARVRNLLRLQAQQRALAAQNARLRALERFRFDTVSMLVHDVRNQLGAILANQEFLAGEISGPDPELIVAVKETKELVQRIEDRVARLLASARSGSGDLLVHPENVSLEVLLSRIAQASSRSMPERRVRVSVQAEPGLEVRGDPELLRRSIDALVSYVLKVNASVSQVELSSEREDRSARIRVAADADCLPRASRGRLFELGAGEEDLVSLRLYLCRMAIEAHGGTVALMDHPKWQTCFELTVPLEPAPA